MRSALAQNIQYTPILLEGFMAMPTNTWEANCLSDMGSATRQISLATDTDSLDRGTPVRILPAAQLQTLVKTGGGSHRQTSTIKPKLMLATQCHVKELFAQIQGALHGAHVKTTRGGASQTQPWGSGLPGWTPARIQEGSRCSSVVSLDDHQDFAMTELS